MGQYFRGCILGKNKKTVIKWVRPYDVGSFAKLMEHGWLRSPFVNKFESLIFKNPQVVVWAGDYADHCKGRKSNLYERCTNTIETTKVIPEVEMKPSQTRFIINHTKKLFVDKTKISKDCEGWKLHPLPFLTCEGNGEGGGDFYGEDTNKIVGSWARCLVSVDDEKPQGYKEIKFLLKGH